MLAWIKHHKIGSKLLFGISSLIVLMIMIGITSYRSTKRIQQNLEGIFTIQLPGLDYVIEADRDLQQLLVAERSLIFSRNTGAIFESLLADYEENFEQSQTRWEKYKALAETPEEKAMMPEYEKARSEWEVISRRIIEMCRSDTSQLRPEAITLSLGEASQKFEEMREYLNLLTELKIELAEGANEAAASTYESTIVTLLSVIAVGLLVGLGLLWTINRGIIRPLGGITEIAKSVAQGDVSQRIEVANKNDEIGQLAGAFRRMTQFTAGEGERSRANRQRQPQCGCERRFRRGRVGQSYGWNEVKSQRHAGRVADNYRAAEARRSWCAL